MLIEFESWHLKLARLPEKMEARMRVHSTELSLTMLGANNLAGTIVAPPLGKRETVILGIMGALETAPGECEVFILSSENKWKFPVEFSRTVSNALKDIRGDFTKIRALGEDTKFFERWFSWLGFSRESAAPKGPDGEDMCMWVMKGRGGGN